MSLPTRPRLYPFRWCRTPPLHAFLSWTRVRACPREREGGERRASCGGRGRAAPGHGPHKTPLPPCSLVPKGRTGTLISQGDRKAIHTPPLKGGPPTQWIQSHAAGRDLAPLEKCGIVVAVQFRMYSVQFIRDPHLHPKEGHIAFLNNLDEPLPVHDRELVAGWASPCRKGSGLVYRERARKRGERSVGYRRWYPTPRSFSPPRSRRWLSTGKRVGGLSLFQQGKLVQG